MLTEKRLSSEIEELMNGKETVQTYEKLANLFIVKDHVYPETPSNGYSADHTPSHVNMIEEVEYTVDDYGDTEFLQKIKGQDAEKMWLLMDEVMETIGVLNPRLYDSIIEKL